jgi:hypothetical protein
MQLPPGMPDLSQLNPGDLPNIDFEKFLKEQKKDK